MAKIRAPSVGEMLEQPSTFVRLLSRHYPIPRTLLAQHPNLWDWEALSENTRLAWDRSLLDEQRDRWAWPELSRNPALPWSVELIGEYVELGVWDWYDLRRQRQILQRPDLLALCLPQWSAAAGSVRDDIFDCVVHMPWGADAHAWAPALVERCETLPWDLFSAVREFPWTADFIDRHRDELDWQRLSSNGGLPWSLALLERFEDRWHWDRLPKKVQWSLELLERFEHRWDFRQLGSYAGIQWPAEWIDRFADRLHWVELPLDEHERWDGTLGGIVNNIEMTPELFDRHRAAIEAVVAQLAEHSPELAPLTEQYWTVFCNPHCWAPELVEQLAARDQLDWHTLSRCGQQVWTRAFVERWRERLDLRALAGNPRFPWAALLDDLAEWLDEHEWRRLSDNFELLLSLDLLQRHADRLDWQKLSAALPLSMCCESRPSRG